VSAMAATKVTAQEVIYNPGYCAQFYPNATCQNKGPNNPYTGDYQLRNHCAARLPGAPIPARRARSPIAAATAGGTSATEGVAKRSAVGRRFHSLAIPISLITRAYLVS
jgi:hypothetical protein